MAYSSEELASRALFEKASMFGEIPAYRPRRHPVLAGRGERVACLTSFGAQPLRLRRAEDKGARKAS
jgi:hypothetical protein